MPADSSGVITMSEDQREGRATTSSSAWRILQFIFRSAAACSARPAVVASRRRRRSQLKRGECLGLVGESGSGKSTVALSILGLQAPTRGRIVLDGQVVTAGNPAIARRWPASCKWCSGPYASLNPRQTVRRTLEDPLRLHGVTARSEIDGRVAEMLRHVGLRPEQAGRYPHEFPAASASASALRAR